VHHLRFGYRSGDLGCDCEPAMKHAPIQRDYSRAQTNAECRRDAAIRDVQALYWTKFQAVKSELQAEIDRINREHLEGKFGHAG
jgi:hypothetical protein